VQNRRSAPHRLAPAVHAPSPDLARRPSDGAFQKDIEPNPPPDGEGGIMPSPVAQIIEIGDVSAGIVVAERRGHRFFSAHPAFTSLDRRSFPSPRIAAIAVQALHSGREPTWEGA
jgi:hypothetical protein